MTETERAEHMVRAAAGDANALQRLLIEYHAALRRLVDGRIDAAFRRRWEPEDVLQDAYIDAFQALDRPVGAPQFGSPAAFYKWLERIVLNRLTDAQRSLCSAKRDVARELPVDRSPRPDCSTTCQDLLGRLSASGTTPSRAVAREEAVGAVLASLARLPEPQRTVIRLRFLEDVPVQRIAELTGQTEAAVYQQCHRGLAALGRILNALPCLWRGP